MKTPLQGKRIAFLATDGFEQVELTRPWQAVKDAGAEPVLVSPKSGKIQGMNHFDKGDQFPVDQELGKADAAEFHGLVLPGGLGNPDELRQNRQAIAFVTSFFEASKPVAAICHAPWLLVEADVVRGRTITSWPSLQTDIKNAGGRWVDEECHVDQGLVTSRNPDDLDAFCKKAVEEFAEGKHSGQHA